MSRGQKVILGLAIFSYIGALTCFLFQMWIVMLIFVCASAILSLSFNLSGGAEIDMVRAEKEEEIAKISTELSASILDNQKKDELLSDKDNALTETMKLYRDAQNNAKAAEKECEDIKEEIDRIKNEAEEKQKIAVAEAVEKAVAEALADAKLSVDDASFAGMDALIPNISSEDVNETLELISLAKETAAEFSEYAKKADIVIKVNSSESELKFVGDPLRIKIMLRNIIDNSIKYMNRAGSLVITLSTVGDEIFIVLKDDGEGLNSSETKHVFELNFQGSNRISGNGLGLTQSKAIANKYNGSIYARSNEGKGMGIYIQLPLYREEEKES